MTWNLARPALFVLIASVALLAPQLADRAHAATTITVDGTSPSNIRDSVLTLREGLLLANGSLTLGDLTTGECDQVSSAFLLGGTLCTALFGQSPGAGSSDTIVFDAGVFSPNSISMGGSAPFPLSAGGDTVDGSGAAGVVIFGDGSICFDITSSNNTIKGLEIRDCQYGVHIRLGAQNNIIGGSSPAERNVISGNSGAGIRMTGVGTSGNIVVGNYIGTGVSGLTSLPNGSGVSIRDGASDNIIGGSTLGERNVISGNAFVGVFIVTAGTNGNVITGNYIGVDATGTVAVPNDIGVSISEVQNTVIGGGNPGEGNVISGNTRFGIEITDPGTDNNTVAGNYIGTNADGTSAIANLLGIQLSAGSGNNRIGGNTPAERNLISGNATGIDIFSSNQNVVSGNYIGTDVTGTAAIPNTVGVLVYGGANANTIGGDSPGDRNVISGNVNSGVRIHDLATTSTTVGGNYIGTSASGEQTLGNGGYGIQLGDLTNGNVIRDNVIAGNGFVGGPSVGGITMFGSNANEIYGNRIGVSPSGAPLGNELFGIYMRNSSNNLIGNTGGDGNIIAFNGSDGVRVTTDGGGSLANTIRGNSIYSNEGLAINNELNGNLELPLPLITGFGSVSGTACPGCTVDVYSDDEDEGETYEGATTADGNGDWTFPGNPAGPNVTATATDNAGNTSEFSEAVVAPEPTPTPSPTPTPFGQTPTPTPIPAGQLTQGDNDCDADTDPADALVGLRHVAGLSSNQQPGCPALGGPLPAAAPAGDPPALFGDVDCDDDVDSVDSLKILRAVAALPVSQNEPCTDIGEPL